MDLNIAQQKNIAVVGASGVVGRALLEQLNASGLTATGFSRRRPADLPDARFEPLDLLDATACQTAAKGALANTTHLVYAALFEKPGLIAGWRQQDQMQTNLQMLRNLLEPLQINNKLTHVTLLQGTKAYGAHIAPMKIPGIENEPRVQHDNFYWLQQDYLEQVCQRRQWNYTIWRPQIIFGHALHAPMNMLAAIGVYAALQRSRGLPLHYPGGPSAITEAVDARLLAKAIEFSLDRPGFANETFNITNGDVFRWQDIWPAITRALGMEPGAPEPVVLSKHLYQEEALWQRITETHGLQPYSIRELVGDSFFYADALFNSSGSQAPPPALLSTIKLRQAGFHDCIDSGAMFKDWFAKLADLKVLPPTA
ncbi:MAG: NAD-dependent epimerase/dehydratase family protein [Pseudomonadales bacterium]